MRLTSLVLGVVLSLTGMGTVAALEVDPVTLVSPITGTPFPAHNIPIKAITGEAMVEMGYDDDGCRHTSGTCEYPYYVTTDPTSYFSALTAEWDPNNGRFLGAIPPDMKSWVDKQFHSEWDVDRQRQYQIAEQLAASHGQPAPDRSTWLMPENSIPLEKRYEYCLECYEHRGARPAVLAKVALMGAWALRCFLNVPIDHQNLLGGFDEVNDKISRHVVNGETFQLAKWLPIVRDLFHKTKLSDEGYLVAGLMYLGYVVRDGDLAEARDIITKMHDRFKDLDTSVRTKPLLLGLVREREHILNAYVGMEDVATRQFISAIMNEEFTRQDLVDSKMLVVAEGLRRTGNPEYAYDWYLALSRMIETQPQLRAELHAANKAPAADVPQAVQVGWIADRQLAALTKSGLVHGDDYAGPDRQLLMEIVNKGFGRGDYVNPYWKPASGGTVDQAQLMLRLIAESVLEYHYRLGTWPSNLNDMWTEGILRDRNRVNRFYDPVKGLPLRYAPPQTNNADELSGRTVLLCTSAALPSNQGDVYLAIRADLRIVTSTTQPVPGEELQKH